MPGEPKNETPFDRKLPNKNPHAPTTHDPPAPRDLLHHYMTATAGNRYGWFYREARPLRYPSVLQAGVIADCSFACAILNHWAKLPDPTGSRYDGYGNSTSMFHHLPHITLHDAHAGDFVVFGVGGSQHATMIYRADPRNPLLWSHGHQGAPNLYPLSADRRPFTVLRNEVPDGR